MMSSIAHAAGYLAGAVGIGFAVAFGLYAGIQAASRAFGPINIKLNLPPIELRHPGDQERK